MFALLAWGNHSSEDKSFDPAYPVGDIFPSSMSSSKSSANAMYISPHHRHHSHAHHARISKAFCASVHAAACAGFDGPHSHI
eukprot:CAMPEP_0173389110 /NCGR_PEP_ID=MMETSP1356-20130122/11265_1 /TAXON_ID=77927 ORGANISM="Hemiselmis virescens, Strain PCC157" /NCGR_SAMPLE_ID=MMETSP1356 /ASSEMBLY_ACC=CAM_ASM_000847 /LENGTH=81 /DNA_ID=CAMNT_0014346177 /DNA_START=29 /DNA_END=274 /DNA_ORIENTATION=+